MKKVLIIGGKLFFGANGYSEFIYPQLLLSNPQFPHKINLFTRESLTYRDVLEDLPQNVIGKAPDYVLFALGCDDILTNSPIDNLIKTIEEIIDLVLDKTQAIIGFINNCSILYSGNNTQLKTCQEINRICNDFVESHDLILIDIDSIAKKFMQLHCKSSGEKKSLYTIGPQLTYLGTLLFSSSVANNIQKKLA